MDSELEIANRPGCAPLLELNTERAKMGYVVPQEQELSENVPVIPFEELQKFIQTDKLRRVEEQEYPVIPLSFSLTI